MTTPLPALSRDELLQKKGTIDSELAKSRVALGQAKAAAFTQNRFLPPTEYAALQLKVKALAQRSQSIQLELGKLNNSRPRNNINDCFRDAAKRVLDEKQFLVIMELAHDLQREREL